MAEKQILWVPTLAAVEAFIGRDGIDRAVAKKTLEEQLISLAKAHDMGISVAAGSDSGAVGVPHGIGSLREYDLLNRAGFTDDEIDASNKKLWELFSRSK